MEILVQQPCPQCSGAVTLSASARLLVCPYCGVKNFLQTRGPFRYTLPDRVVDDQQDQRLYAPYLRFKGTVFLITEKGISHRIVDTTRNGFPLPGLAPSLGVRPQAMKLVRLHRKTRGRFLRLSVKAKVLLEQATRLDNLVAKNGSELLHRAYIGEHISFIYLPLVRKDTMLLDAVIDKPLVSLDQPGLLPLQGTPFNPRWQMNFLPTLCPRCGWSLDGEGDCLVLTCSNCKTAWQAGHKGLERISCTIIPGRETTALYLGFWKIRVQFPSLGLKSFADFIQLTNQPLVPRREWHDQALYFWIPAFKLRPKSFLRAGRQATVNQWRLAREKELEILPNLYPVTLPSTEARQALKITLAASAISRKKVFPYLHKAHPEPGSSKLVFLPCIDRYHDWVQPDTGIVLAKKILGFGRKL